MLKLWRGDKMCLLVYGERRPCQRCFFSWPLDSTWLLLTHARGKKNNSLVKNKNTFDFLANNHLLSDLNCFDTCRLVIRHINVSCGVKRSGRKKAIISPLDINGETRECFLDFWSSHCCFVLLFYCLCPVNDKCQWFSWLSRRSNGPSSSQGAFK